MPRICVKDTTMWPQPRQHCKVMVVTVKAANNASSQDGSSAISLTQVTFQLQCLFYRCISQHEPLIVRAKPLPEHLLDALVSPALHSRREGSLGRAGLGPAGRRQRPLQPRAVLTASVAIAAGPLWGAGRKAGPRPPGGAAADGAVIRVCPVFTTPSRPTPSRPIRPRPIPSRPVPSRPVRPAPWAAACGGARRCGRRPAARPRSGGARQVGSRRLPATSACLPALRTWRAPGAAGRAGGRGHRLRFPGETAGKTELGPPHLLVAGLPRCRTALLCLRQGGSPWVPACAGDLFPNTASAVSPQGLHWAGRCWLWDPGPAQCHSVAWRMSVLRRQRDLELGARFGVRWELVL